MAGSAAPQQGLWMRQYKALFKRNYLIKVRFWKATMWEFIIPAVFLLVFGAIQLSLKAGFKDPETEFPAESIGGKTSIGFTMGELIASPNETATNQIVAQVCAQLQCTYRMFDDDDAAVDYYKEQKVSRLGVFFNFTNSSVYHYTIRYPKTASVPSNLISTNLGDCSYGYCPASSTLSSGIALLQTALDSAIIAVSNPAFQKPTLQAQLMPELGFLNTSNSTIRIMFPLYFVYAMAYIVMYLCGPIIDDKFKNRKDHLVMMGVRPSAFWAAWAVVNLPQAAFVSICGLIVMAAFSFFSTGIALGFFFVAVVIYSLNNILIGIVWSFFLQKKEWVFFALLGTVAIGGIGLVNLYTTDYLTDRSNPTSNLAPLGGIICLLPPACMVSILERMYTLDATYPGGLTGAAFSAGDLTLITMLIILIVDLFLWFILAMWLDGVLPNALGARLSLCFCFDKKYWKPDPADPAVVKAYEQSLMVDEHADVEPIARAMIGKEAVRLFDIRKEFVQSSGFSKKETVKAVNGVNLDIYEGQITALLGHNGAGKTTLINMMTGIMPATSGSATLYGYDVMNGVDLQSIRQMMGICPQHDVFLDRITVKEHLELYAAIKGVPDHEIAKKIQTTVEDCDLVDQIDMPANELSGGQKRKLNIGMALIGDPKILFLDEPTAGMDPYSRRHLWDLLKKSRKDRVILLTTHFMDEADILADRKAVISKGKLQCAGSSMYMKNRFGIGYQLSLVMENTERLEALTSLITEIIEGSSFKRTYGMEITYNLPVEHSAKFAELFSTLDSKREELMLSSYSISMTSLEEVFLKLGEQAEEEERREKEKNRESDDHSLSQTGANDVTVNLTTGQEEELVNPINLVKEPGVNTSWLRIWFMTKQRFRMMPREKYIIVFTVIFAIFLGVGVALIVSSKPGVVDPTTPPSQKLDLHSTLSNNQVQMSERSRYNAHTVLYNNITGGNLDVLVLNLPLSNFTLQSYDGDFAKSDPSPFGYDVNEFSSVTASSNLTVRYNHTYLLSLPLAINTLSRALFKVSSSNPKAEIAATLWEWPSFDSFTLEVTAGSFAGLPIIFALYMGSSIFAIGIVLEKELHIRSLLRTAGITVGGYFGAFMLIYYMLLFPILLIGLIVILAFQVPAYEAAAAGVLFVLHCIIQLTCTILLHFCWSYAFDRAQSAGVIASINIWIAMMITVPVQVMISIPKVVDIALILHHILCFTVPYYAFPGGLLMIEYTYRSYLLETLDLTAVPPSVRYFWFKNGLMSAILGGIFWCVILWILLRVLEIRSTNGKLSDVFKCSSNSISNYDPSAKNTDLLADEDEDVAKERSEVNDILEGGASRSKEIIMLCRNLRKKFNQGKKKKPKVAVRNVTFHVPPGEVFGLLGPNGAGKTTVLNMIIAEHAPTAGQVMVDGVEVHSALSEAFSIIGYCPQFDAQWQTATPTEMLVLFGISAGMTEAQAVTVTNYYIKMLKIEEHKDKYSRDLSGGTRRKVSFALAMMGWPKLVLLDEPSTGLDPTSKRFLWDAIRSSFHGYDRAAVLTTHYMEEADALCSRIGIMVNGGLECLGTAHHLKQKYGDGYQLEIKLRDSDDTESNMEELKRFVAESFPQSSIVELFSDRIQYAMPTSSITSPAEVFSPVELNKERLQIEEYSFTQSTLEQVFIQFAKQQLEADEDEDNATKSRQKSKQMIRQRSVVGVPNPSYTHL